MLDSDLDIHGSSKDVMSADATSNESNGATAQR
jgi:hypothetical protein